MEFLIEIDGKIYEISDLVSDISYADQLNNGCSTLDFDLINQDIEIKNGSTVRFRYKDKPVFYGRVFKHRLNEKGVCRIKACDQLRYAKAKDTIVIKDESLTNLVTRMCNYFSFPAGVLEETGYQLPVSVQDDKTWLDIIYNGISDTLMGTEKWYCLRDEFGSIALRNMESLALPLVLGDGSLCYGFERELSIDSDFYNYIKLSADNEISGLKDFYEEYDEESVKRYGFLQYYAAENQNTSPEKIREKAKILKKRYGTENEKLSFECIGDLSVRAGCSIYGIIDGIKLQKKLVVNSVTHKFLPAHTMSVEVLA